jgi:peptidoglycan L-alanyl-D-glutamate endopeptidase CwlK
MDARSTNSLKGVHPDLVKIFTHAHAMAEVKPVVTEGLRTVARQKQLVAKGASRTMNSRHITGHALDVAFIFGREVRWDWPLYKTFADVMKKAAKELGLNIEWGGDWKSFKDGPHFQLPFGKYPK